MKFVSPRDYVLASTMGHTIRFEKGVPQYVPPMLHREAVSIGAVPEETLDEPQPKASNEPTLPADREKAVFAVFERLVLADKSADFTSGGVPKDKAMERELGWAIEAKETAEFWKAFKLGTKA